MLLLYRVGKLSILLVGIFFDHQSFGCSIQTGHEPGRIALSCFLDFSGSLELYVFGIRFPQSKALILTRFPQKRDKGRFMAPCLELILYNSTQPVNGFHIICYDIDFIL